MAFSETTFSTSLTSALDSYVRSHSTVNLGGCYTPDIKSQALHKFESGSGFDLLKRLNECHTLILELKVLQNIPSDYKKSDQYLFYSVFNKYGVPLRYCYNLVQDYISRNCPIYTLDNSQSCFPNALYDGKGGIDVNGHETLRQIIDYLLSDGTPCGIIGEIIGAVALSDLSEITTSILLIAYHPELKQIAILTPEFCKFLIKELCKLDMINNIDKDQLSDENYLTTALDHISSHINKTIEALNSNYNFATLRPEPEPEPEQTQSKTQPQQPKGSKFKLG